MRDRNRSRFSHFDAYVAPAALTETIFHTIYWLLHERYPFSLTFSENRGHISKFRFKGHFLKVLYPTLPVNILKDKTGWCIFVI